MRKKRLIHLFGLILLISLVGCSPESNIRLLNSSAFDTIVDNRKVSLYTLKNQNGMTMQVTNFGARVVSFWVADRNGHFDDIVLGYEEISRYLNNKGERFLGATIGRVGNRIANGRFLLYGVTYQLSTFNNGQCLHGGNKGFDAVVWSVDSIGESSILFSYLSVDGQEGFPGNLSVKMRYTLTDKNEFKIDYEATTDKATPINLTHHSFFNLKGEGNGTINDHILHINADYFTPVDSVLIPLDKNISVENTPFDFRQPTAIGARVDEDNLQLLMGSGYDHNFVLNRKGNHSLELAATVYEPLGGRFMEVWTTEPGLQFYGGNFFTGTTNGKYNDPLSYRESFALEAQHFPDSPNRPDFPNTILHPSEKYTQTTIYRFSCH